MLVLLPPSEGKAAPSKRGRPLDLDDLSFPELTDTRKQVLAALIETSAHPRALEYLDVGPSLAGEVARNTALATAATAPAHSVYSGVLYEALGWASLSAAARRRGNNRVLISSALWGWVRPNDRIPAYRLSMDSTLPATEPLARQWRRVASSTLIDQAGPRGVIVDCRSGPYAAAAPIPEMLAKRAVNVRVLREAPNGTRTVVSHLAKHTRGEVARHLLELPKNPVNPRQLAEALGTRWPVELTQTAGKPFTLDVVLRESI